jgi:hypothetical protein
MALGTPAWPQALTSSSDGLGFQHANLREHPGKIVDAAFAHDLTIPELVRKDRGDAERFATRGQSQKSTHVAPLDAQDLRDMVAIDHQVLGASFLIEKSFEHCFQDILYSRPARVRAPRRAVDDTVVGIVGG